MGVLGSSKEDGVERRDIFLSNFLGFRSKRERWAEGGGFAQAMNMIKDSETLAMIAE